MQHVNPNNHRYADALEQLDTGRKISPHPAEWKCDETGVTANLWLNLSTGHIGSGRQVGSKFKLCMYLLAWVQRCVYAVLA